MFMSMGTLLGIFLLMLNIIIVQTIDSMAVYFETCIKSQVNSRLQVQLIYKIYRSRKYMTCSAVYYPY